MDFLEKIKDLSDEALRNVVRERIEKLEAEKPSDELIEIGYIVDYNPKKYDMYGLGKEKYFEFSMNNFYSGYIKKGTKIIYGITYDKDGYVGNLGNYYYLDDEDYLYEFCKYAKDKGITNEYELFDVILVFLRKYFRVISNISRSEMHQLIYKNEKEFFPLVREHSIKDFKGKGNALCTEYTLMAQNILNLFCIESYVVLGKERLGDQIGGFHAFNIISFDEKETGEEVNALIDFSLPVNVYDMNFKVLGESPYLVFLDQFDEEFVQSFLDDNKKIETEDYGYMIFGNTIIYIGYKRKRCYYLDDFIMGDESIMRKTLQKKD